MAIDFQLGRDRVVGLTAGGSQHDAAAQNDLLGSAEGKSPLLQLSLITVAER